MMYKQCGVLLITLLTLGLHAQPAWELKKDKNGIKIYTADQANSAYKCVKVECTVDAKFSQLVALFFDIDKHHEWVYNTKSAELCKKLSDSELIYYSEVSAPWPFTNRDFIAHLKVCERSAQVLTIESHVEPAFRECKDNCVRIQSSDSYWTMTSINNKLVRIDYIITFNPGGAIPAWLINLFLTEGPYETFKNLKERVHSPAYQNAHYSFIRH